MFSDIQSVHNPSKDPKPETSVLRQKFQLFLGKLTQTDTKDIALRELQSLILNNQEPQHLRTFLSVLAQHKRPLNYTSNEQEVLVIGYICSVFKDNLLDPLDQPPSLPKSAFRVTELLKKYFKDPNVNVQNACAKTWKEIYKNVLLNESLEARMLILFDTLSTNINSGVDRISQETSFLVLDEFLELLVKMDEKDMLAAITKKILPLYFEQVIQILKEVCKDRILKVQTAARSALKEWLNLEKNIDFLEQKKVSRQPFNENLDIDQIIEKKTQSDPNLIQLQQKNMQNYQNQLEIQSVDKETDIQNVMAEKGGWVKETRGRNFQKKRTGTGGGQNVSVSPHRSKSAGRTRKSIKELIMNAPGYEKRTKSKDILQNFQYLGQDFQNSNQKNNQKRAIQSESNVYQPIQNIEVLPINQHIQIEKKLIDSLEDGNQNLNEIQKNQKSHKFYNTNNSTQQNWLSQNRIQEQDNYGQFQNNTHYENYLKSQQKNKQNFQFNDFKKQEEQDENNSNLENQEDDYLDQTLDYNSQVFENTENNYNKNNNQNYEKSLEQIQKQKQENKSQQQPTLWEQVLNLLQQGDYDQSFTLILDSNDDLYFLRLLMISGKCMGKLYRQRVRLRTTYR
ncbi:Armadillo-type fold [Pseudocohnilembus persalinus]|uniref:Armadillo-type fold n=1 Tax=Pseudocohnilembus persalinus TaxID=266149 RepID=A0A0V0QG97_PSEPJ|nr:Armadillo-type fold [Pseudocohnilembus persalinus]|eukprot:KRX01077.1 Armadillo-type fold [Pseudocohnilembus persalinus]